MRTVTQFVNLVYEKLTEANLPITGKIYKLQRPRSNRLEDIVINTLVFQTIDQAVNTGYVNANVYVPGLDPDGDGPFIPDTARMETLGSLICNLFNPGFMGYISDGSYTLNVDGQNIFRDDQTYEFYLNIRIFGTLIN